MSIDYACCTKTNDMKILNLLWTCVRDAGWALVLVFLFRGLAIALGVRPQLDHPIHFSGGFAIAYFLYRAIRMASPFIGPLTPAARFCLAFSSACTAAVFWEFGEFASDLLIGTHIQYAVAETLWDLISGVLGAVASLSLIALINRLKNNYK